MRSQTNDPTPQLRLALLEGDQELDELLRGIARSRGWRLQILKYEPELFDRLRRQHPVPDVALACQSGRRGSEWIRELKLALVAVPLIVLGAGNYSGRN